MICPMTLIGAVIRSMTGPNEPVREARPNPPLLPINIRRKFALRRWRIFYPGGPHRVLTPKAVVRPVRLAGTTVTNATLHNQDFHLGKGHSHWRHGENPQGGEIIPEILEVEFDKRPAGAEPYRLPEVCPVCGAPVVGMRTVPSLRCTGRGMSGAALPEHCPFCLPGRHGH